MPCALLGLGAEVGGSGFSSSGSTIAIGIIFFTGSDQDVPHLDCKPGPTSAHKCCTHKRERYRAAQPLGGQELACTRPVHPLCFCFVLCRGKSTWDLWPMSPIGFTLRCFSFHRGIKQGGNEPGCKQYREPEPPCSQWPLGVPTYTWATTDGRGEWMFSSLILKLLCFPELVTAACRSISPKERHACEFVCIVLCFAVFVGSLFTGAPVLGAAPVASSISLLGRCVDRRSRSRGTRVSAQRGRGKQR